MLLVLMAASQTLATVSKIFHLTLLRVPWDPLSSLSIAEGSPEWLPLFTKETEARTDSSLLPSPATTERNGFGSPEQRARTAPVGRGRTMADPQQQAVENNTDWKGK